MALSEPVTAATEPVIRVRGLTKRYGDPIDQMPDRLKGIARVIPLTYLADPLRQVMVGGTPFAPLWVCAAVLVGWLAVCFGIAAAKFRWQ